MAYRGLIIDLFGVVCAEVASPWLAVHLEPASAELAKSTLLAAADTGELSYQALISELASRTGIRPRQIHDDWLEAASLDHSLIAFLNERRPRQRSVLLTNGPSDLCRAVISRHNLEPTFHSIIVSSEVRVAKPDPAAYALALEALAVPKEHVLFVDDKPVNVAGARRVGIASLLFSTLSTLQTALDSSSPQTSR